MKILHVAETVKGGVATVINQLITEPSEDDVFCIIPQEQVDEIKNSAGCTITFRRKGRTWRTYFSLLFVYLKFVIKNKPDIIHIHSSYAGFICRLVLPLIYLFYKPTVVYCPHAFSFLMNTSKVKKNIYSYVEIILSYLTDKIICVSIYEKEQAIIYRINPDKLIAIYNGVREPLDYDVSDNPFNKNKINIVFVGRFDYQKGFDLILNLASMIDDRFIITAIGERVLKNTEENSHPDINYTGWLSLEDIGKFLKFADVLIMPSRWESFGLVAVEAQSYGLPVVASNCTSLPEVVISEKTGYLFEPENVDQMFEIITSRNKEDWKLMKGDCIKHYKDNFLSEIMVFKTKQLYRELLIKE